MGKIEDVERYDRYYDMTYDGIQSRMFPGITLPAGSMVVRGNDPQYDARVIPPGSGSKLTNRFSGLRLDGRAGQGALRWHADWRAARTRALRDARRDQAASQGLETFRERCDVRVHARAASGRGCGPRL